MDKYTWRDVGSSYVMSDILAAFLYAQLRRADRIQKVRQRIWRRYFQELKDWASRNDVRLPVVPQHCEHPAHLFYLLFPNSRQRDAVMAYLKARGILAVFHYLPLHLSSMGRRFGGRRGQCPVAETIAHRLLRLPLYTELSLPEQDKIIRLIHKCPL